MVRSLIIACVLTAIGCAATADTGVERSASRAIVSATPLGFRAGRIGVNLGSWTAWGAEQLSANVIKNPGFEGLIDRSLIVVTSPSGQTVHDDSAFLSRPTGFWDQARWSARTGAAAGREGLVRRSRSAPGTLPAFELDSPALAVGDIVSLTRVRDDELPTQWWIHESSRSMVDTEAGDPSGSGGMRSLRLSPVRGQNATITSYLDAIGARAGTLLPVTGQWRLTFWARRAFGTANLRLSLRRAGLPPIVDRTLEPSSTWHRETMVFEGERPGAEGTLALQLEAAGAGRILVDDVDLRRTSDEGRAFRHEVEDTLRTLQPGYLRDWQGQLGDTLANRVASPGARRASRYRPGDEFQTDYGYSLTDFLSLARDLGSRPWVVMPTTFSDGECRELGRLLATWTAFDEIVVEFGNENWNPLFRAAGIIEVRAHTAAAGRAFELVREGAGLRAPIHFVINAQHANAGQHRAIAAAAPAGASVGLAPYYLPRLAANAGVAALFDVSTAFNQTGDVAIYEVNAHTLGGNAAPDVRAAVVAGRASGAALAAQLLNAQAAGIDRQCVYALAGFDAWLDDRSGFARLFGLVRDLGPTQRMRPSGLAVTMLNRAILGEVHGVAIAGASSVTALAFTSSGRWSAAAVNRSGADVDTTWTFPSGVAPREVLTLGGAETDTNEDAERVRILSSTIAAQAVVRIPAYGLVVLLPPGD